MSTPEGGVERRPRPVDEFSEFFETIQAVQRHLQTIERAGIAVPDVMDSFWRFGSALSDLHSIDPGSNDRAHSLREATRESLSMAGEYYQAFERRYGAEGIAALREICTDLSTTEAAIADLLQQHAEDAELDNSDIEALFRLQHRLPPQLRNSLQQSVELIGDPLKLELKRLGSVRRRFDALVRGKSND
jgi:hypothetical protein